MDWVVKHKEQLLAIVMVFVTIAILSLGAVLFVLLFNFTKELLKIVMNIFLL